MIAREHQADWWSESEERLRAFIEHAPRKLWISRTDGTVEFFNRKWRDYTGQPLEIGTRTWREVVHPDDRPKLEAIRTRAVPAVEPYDVQIRLRRGHDGSYRWHMGRVAPVHLHSELIAWIGAATDIDARVRAEIALRESEANFRTMADAIPHLAWMREPEDEKFWFNQRWFRFTGVTIDQMRNDGWRSVIHPDHVDSMLNIVQQGRARGEPWEYTAPLRRKDGTYRWFLFRGVPIRNETTGSVSRWFGTGTDVHEQQKAQERQLLMTQEVSHRVKNSLALVAGQLAIQARAADESEAKKVLLDAYARVLTIAGVHDHLWRQYDSRVTEISSFLRDLCEKLQQTAPEHDVLFEGAHLTVPTDQAVPIGLVVNELVTNALKYAYPEGQGGTVWINLREAEEGSLILEVTDRGRGVPEGFDIFAPSKSLGMKFLVMTIRQLGATVSVIRGEPGTKFEIRIPVRER